MHYSGKTKGKFISYFTLFVSDYNFLFNMKLGDNQATIVTKAKHTETSCEKRSNTHIDP